MSYTTLQVTHAGVPLAAAHLRRLAKGAVEQRRLAPLFDRFVRDAVPAVYSLRFNGQRIQASPPRQSALLYSLPTRRRVTPLPFDAGPVEKPAPPCAYDAVRSPGVLTLLTDPTDSELLEACVASLLAFDGRVVCAVPLQRPRVISLAEHFFVNHFSVSRQVIAVDSHWPLLAVNAAVGAVPVVSEGRDPFPPALQQEFQAAFLSTVG
jgi:hypothetical protein